MSGKGHEIMENGAVYIGSYEKGKSHGNGTLLSTDGKFYSGEFAHGLPHGHGTEFIPSGEWYEGEFVAGKREGHGVLICGNATYKGYWKNGNPSGQGELHFMDGSYYAGDWVNGIREGKGSFKWANGEMYTGDWQAGQRTGKGEHSWPNGDKYVGDFLNGNFHGQGTFRWNSGAYHSGTWKDGVIFGLGEHKFDDGRVVEGEWEGEADASEPMCCLPTAQKGVKDHKDVPMDSVCTTSLEVNTGMAPAKGNALTSSASSGSVEFYRKAFEESEVKRAQAEKEKLSLQRELATMKMQHQKQDTEPVSSLVNSTNKS
ncbi:phosphatidylinositol-4-phosphate 5-kinase [Pelomyxa schiedti]|nr:phosphatidylinositol-4-phosphate 5-kinase [Pelomyxa schiedti]